MASSFSIKNSQIAVFCTLMVLILLGASYFFIYVPNNEKVVQERHFLCLQNIDSNIHSKITNSLMQINGLLEVDTLHQKAVLDTYINKYPKTNFVIIPVQHMGWQKGKKVFKKAAVEVDPDSKLLTLFANKPILKSDKDTSSLTRIGIRYGFEQFFKPLLPLDNFENYVVFYGNKLVYETFQSGLSFTKSDSLLQLKSGIISPGLHSVSIGGKDYKLFSQSVNINANHEWIIAGLVSSKDYEKEKNQLPLWIVLLLVTIAIGIIVSLPWLKLYHMGSKDKLTVTDGISTVLISMLLMSFLFFVVFKYSFYFSTNYRHLANSKEILPAQIIKAFETDLDTASSLLTKFDLAYNNPKLQSNVINLGKDSAKYQDTPDKIKYSPLEIQRSLLERRDSSNIIVHQVYWLNSNGTELNNWIEGNVSVPHTRYNLRAYFKGIIADKPNRTGTDQFIDQVISRTSGAFTSIIAKKSKNKPAKVAAMSFTARSLDNVIIPDGYQFAVIDSTGEVLYHSMADRNLNENMLKELADSSYLLSAMIAKADTSFTTEYYGRQYKVKIKPFADLPYYTLILEDLEYNDARDTESYTFTLSMLAFMLFFQVIQVGIVFFASSKRSFFKKQLFETSWIGPKTTSHHQYNLAILANVAVIILLIFYFERISFLRYLYILLFSITSIAVFLNIVFVIKYKNEHKKGNRFFKLIAIGWLSLFVLLIDISAFFTLTLRNFWWLLSFELLLAAICFVSYLIGEPLLQKARDLKAKSPKIKQYWTYTHSFAMMTTTRLVISSGIPIAFFFIYAYNYEQNLDSRYRQLNFSKDLTQKRTSADIIDTLTGCIKRDLTKIPGAYYDGMSISGIDTANTNNKITYSYEDSLTACILGSLRLINNTLELRNSNINNASVDNKAFFNNLTHQHSYRKDLTITRYSLGDNNYFQLKSGHIDYPQLPVQFWLLLIAGIIIFYYVIHNIIRKLFALNLPSVSGWEMMDEKLLLDNKLNSLVFVLGSPGSGKLKLIKKKLKYNQRTEEQEKELLFLAETDQFELRKKKLAEFNADKLLCNDGELLIYDEDDPSKNNVFIADMIYISVQKGEDDPDWKQCREEAFKPYYSLVIIDHFEYNIKDSRANTIKLDFLESLMQKSKSKIMIVSTVHPLTFLDSFNELQQSKTDDDKANNRIPESELERWHVLLGHFRIVIVPLNDISKPGNQRLLPAKPDPLHHDILEETKYTHYLNNMYPVTMSTATSIYEKYGNDESDLADSMIFKLQISSHYFYTYIWQSLTKEEKFLLYDLAEDGLVNPYDDYNLSMLISKGLIIKQCGTLVLFNKGFRNFILTAIGNTEVNRIKDQVKDNGNWGSLKTPLIISIVAILAFLITSEQEAYSRIITYVTALGAGVPAVLKIFSLFQNNTQKAP
ncbi:cache domain-containing protein [Mucilaginibacter frigoritolerans]|nr:cache domain-containing protein [Mucilaginibacter frigoritolerans]